MWAFLDQERRLRSGWVIAIYALLAMIIRTVLDTLQALLHLWPDEPFTLDDGKLFFSTSATFFCALIPTLIIAAAVRRKPSLHRPALFFPGLLFGAAACSATIVGGSLFGGPSLASTPYSFQRLLLGGAWQLLILGPTAFGEELLVRGIPLDELRRGTNKAVAVLLTSLTFGALHLFNPGSTLTAALNVSLVGVWFALLTLKTGSLWPSMGAHVAWNWFEGFFFGQPVSGIHPATAVFTSVPAEHASFLAGGAFGPEGSGLTAVVLVGCCAVTLLWRKTSTLPI